jgi:hypothetical protein
MSIRRAIPLPLILATATAVLCAAAPAGATVNGLPELLPPDQATALATAPAAVPTGSTTSAVDGKAALDASTVPGADTSIEAGLSPQEAVGLVPPIGANLISATKPKCWSNQAWSEWGTWPYQQRITDTTYWCAVYSNHITYRTSTTTASGTLCGVAWRSMMVIAGGVGRGFTYFTNRAAAGFSCPTVIPWITIHTSHHEDVKRNDRGLTTFVGTG